MTAVERWYMCREVTSPPPGYAGWEMVRASSQAAAAAAFAEDRLQLAPGDQVRVHVHELKYDQYVEMHVAARLQCTATIPPGDGDA